MNIEGRISVFINRNETTIEVRDSKANTTFAVVKLTPEQLCQALSRTVMVECSMEVYGLDRVGKQHQNKSFEFEIDRHMRSSKFGIELQSIAQSILDKNNDGWIAESYFGSQDSFFTKDGKDYARVVIRRWI